MMNEIWLILGHLGVLTVFGALGALVFRKTFNLQWFVIALALYFGYDVLLTRGLFTIPNLPIDASWNWLGKMMAMTGVLAIAALPRFGFAKSGLTLSQNPDSKSAYIVFVLLTAIVFYFAVTTGDGPDSMETIAFQWTMPGLDEEIFYRGVLLLAMNEAFRARTSILGAPIGYGGFLTMIIFGLTHAMDFGADGFSFDMMTFAITGIPSFILLWMREKTGSVVLPILAHNVVNGAFTLF